MKKFGLYDLKDYEQCVCIGTMKDIANYLNTSLNSMWSHYTKKQKGKVKYIRQRYDLVEIEEGK